MRSRRAGVWPARLRNSHLLGMRPNGSGNSQPLSVPAERVRRVFERLSRYLGRLSKSTAVGNVHRFRTNGRRVEALVRRLSAETRNQRKLLKLIARLRKKSGKLRDLDVQIALLKNMRIPDRQNHRGRLLHLLHEEQVRRSRKLAKTLDRDLLRELRKRLRREQTQIRLEGIDVVRLAFDALPKLEHVPLTEKVMHECRIAAKQARYLAELAPESAPAKLCVQELRRAQDAIGEWHDVLKLKQRAEEQFGSAQESSLVSMLENVARARFRTAGNALWGALRTLAREQRGAEAVPGRKGAELDSHLRTTAAA